ncbi:MAG: citramalate synthase [Candidatus Pacebacteria bacterium]|nr:citramalate synthase [Candidatus Paceibacterota bacterium]
MPSPANHQTRITLFDTTLRDGAQTRGVDFTVADKQAIALMLDELGIDYIEGGWPGANPTDDAFFAAPTASGQGFKKAKFTAFGMTRRSGRSASNDPGLAALMNSGANSLCIVGKAWDHQIKLALGIDLAENLAMIGESIDYIAKSGREALFDCEHFFDGYKSNPAFALDCAKTALKNGARWVVLCDTNGGTLPHEVASIVAAVAREIPGENLGIHAHNDTENAVANSLAAVQAGARQIQGTLNGLGERCGNANLVSLLPSLMLKMGYETGVNRDHLTGLTRISRALDERLNRAPNRHAAYVGESAFAHKGGLHASAVEKDATTYEHVAPELVGNQRLVLVSDQAGRANILRRCREIGIDLNNDSPLLPALVDLVKNREFYGYAYDGADASFELLARRLLGLVKEPFLVKKFRVLIERQPIHSALLDHHQDMEATVEAISEATVQITVDGESRLEVAEGNGPVNALDQAMRKALIARFPVLADLQLVDYKVRILNSGDGTMAVTRVMIDSSTANGHRWSTVGVSANVIDASFLALNDALCYRLLMG